MKLDRYWFLSVVMFILIFLAGFSVADEYTPLDDMRLSVGQTEEFNIIVENKMSIQDVMEIEFEGEGLNFVDINLTNEFDYIQDDYEDNDHCTNYEDLQDHHNDDLIGCCKDPGYDCHIPVDRGEEIVMDYEIEAVFSEGVGDAQGDIISTVKSQETQLTERDRVTVIVEAVDEDGVVESSALSYAGIFVLVLSGAILYLFYKS